MYNIFIVYINEAHAADVWNIGESAGTINYKHKTIEDRIGYMNKFITEYKIDIPMYADAISDEFEKTYACWPTRFFVTENTKLTKIGMPQDSEFDFFELFDFLGKK